MKKDGSSPNVRSSPKHLMRSSESSDIQSTYEDMNDKLIQEKHKQNVDLKNQIEVLLRTQKQKIEQLRSTLCLNFDPEVLFSYKNSMVISGIALLCHV